LGWVEGYQHQDEYEPECSYDNRLSNLFRSVHDCRSPPFCELEKSLDERKDEGVREIERVEKGAFDCSVGVTSLKLVPDVNDGVSMSAGAASGF
jgi:hypothetical protein